MSAASPRRRCPVCGNYLDAADRYDPDETLCTPLSCAAWTFTARLTKQGAKPVRPDGRAALVAVDGVV